MIKFDAPVLNEVGDLPIYPFPPSNVSQRNKWVLDCVLEWNGTFIDNDLTIVKTLANNFNGSTDWSDNWDGKYNDHVKGLIAREMETGNYQNLPRPFGPSSSWQVAYTMQLAIVPAGDKWHIIKHVMFDELQKLVKVEAELACGSVYCHSWWPRNPVRTKTIVQ